MSVMTGVTARDTIRSTQYIRMQIIPSRGEHAQPDGHAPLGAVVSCPDIEIDTVVVNLHELTHSG
jgi:hypothetical protein